MGYDPKDWEEQGGGINAIMPRRGLNNTIGSLMAEFSAADVAARRGQDADQSFRGDEVETLRRLLGEAREHVAALLSANVFSNEQQRAIVRARRWLEAVRR